MQSDISTMSCVFVEIFLVRGFSGSWMRIWDEEGVGKGEPEGVLLGPAIRDGSWPRSGADDIGGKDGEKTDGGLPSLEGGRRW